MLSPRSSNTLLICGLLLCACTAGKDYEQPGLDIDPRWYALQNTQLPKAEPYSGDWWGQFDDPVLSALLDMALANNNDLKTAQAHVDEARANEHNANAALFPEIDGTSSGTREKLSAASGKYVDTTSQYGLSGTLDLDLFGSNRRRLQAAVASRQAQEAQRDQTRLTVISDVAQHYVRLRSLQQQRVLTLKNLDMQQDTLKVTQGQREQGAVSDLEVVRAQAQVGATSARLPQIKTAEFAELNRLRTLTDQKFDSIQRLLEDVQPIPVIADSDVVSTPANIIAQRPDVRSSERQLAASSALTAAAIADFYPKLSLQGLFGRQNDAFYGNSTPWSATLSGLLPILDFGRLSSQLNAADARQQQAFFAYRQTVLLAVEETENAYCAYVNEQTRQATLAVVADQQAKAAEIAREQYKSGVTTQLDLLLAESNQLQAENDLTLSQQAVAENIILLHRALGDSGSQEKHVDITEHKDEATAVKATGTSANPQADLPISDSNSPEDHVACPSCK